MEITDIRSFTDHETDVVAGALMAYMEKFAEIDAEQTEVIEDFLNALANADGIDFLEK